MMMYCTVFLSTRDIAHLRFSVEIHLNSCSVLGNKAEISVHNDVIAYAGFQDNCVCVERECVYVCVL